MLDPLPKSVPNPAPAVRYHQVAGMVVINRPVMMRLDSLSWGGRIERHDEQREAGGIGNLAGGSCADNHMGGQRRVAHHDFLTVEHPIRPIAAGGGLHRVERLAGSGFKGRESRHDVTGGNASDKVAGHFGVRPPQQPAAEHHRADERLDDEMASEHLANDKYFLGATTEATAVLGQRRGEDAELLGEGLPHLRLPPDIRARRALVFKAYRLDRKSDIECFRSCCSSVRLKSMVIFALVCQRPSWALARMLR